MEKLTHHGVTIDEFQQVINSPSRVEKSRTSDNMIAFGLTADNRRLACVYEIVDEAHIYVVTAFEV
ncbi:MAG TPA: hypothetical protein VHZ24_12270 [Pirellulales bacterium]|nr:hypothetical protein [Pirellulales bacterium]